MNDLTIAFLAPDRPPPSFTVCVNFGLATGRDATLAEIDRLGARLLNVDGDVDVSIVSETRHQIGAHAESRVHQVLIEVTGDAERAELLLEAAEAWANECAADRGVAP